jgi:signal transduction histidine kinase
VSHELRTPLSAILGYTELMLEEEPGHADLARIHSSGRHLLALVDDVLDLSRIEEERLELDLGAVPLARVVQETIDAVRPMVDGRPIELSVEVSTDLHVRADPARLRQVLTNLLGNACKFTEAGRVDLRARHDGELVVVEVSDTGRGMTAEEQRLCFEPFEQLGPDSSAGGAGLGLAISRRLVLLMGGEVGVDSEPGVGSTFIVRLKAA